MFNNPGKKIQSIAIVYFIFFTFLSVYLAFRLGITESPFTGEKVIIMEGVHVDGRPGNAGKRENDSDNTANAGQPVPMPQQENLPAENIRSAEILKEDLTNDAEDDRLIDIICPYCGETLTYSKSVLTENTGLTCPLCDKTFLTKN